MTKHFPMFAVAGLAACAVVAGASHAQTTVTLYGIADANVRVDHTSIGNLRSIGSGGEDATRWGLRGTEDLGAGWKALFNFEQDFDVGDNSVTQGDIAGFTQTSRGGRLFGRRAIVGLRSTTLGELRIGRETTAYYDTWKRADPFEAGTVGRAANFGIGNVSRYDNAVTYESPQWGGVQFEAQFSPGEATTDDLNGVRKDALNAVSASLAYRDGPLYVGAAVRTERQPYRLRKAATVGAVYDFGVAKLHAMYFYVNHDTESYREYQSYALGATVPIGAFTLLGTVARIDNRDHESPTDAGFFALGAKYAFSKRTNLYVAAAKMSNHGAAAFAIEDNSNQGLYTDANVPEGFRPWSAQFGIHHRF